MNLSWSRGFFLFLLFASNCAKPFGPKDKNPSTDLKYLLVLLASPASMAPLQEPRPFRGRSFSVWEGGGSQVYDWNSEAVITTLSSPDAPRSFLSDSDSGRFAYWDNNSTEIKILDSGMNLSPHGDHYHLDKESPNVSTRASLSQTGSSPRSVVSKNGRAGIAFTGGLVRILEEKSLVSGNSATIISLTPLPSDPKYVIPINSLKVIVVENSGVLSFFENGSAVTRPSDAINCPGASMPATHQTPVSNQSFQNLNAEFAYTHTVVMSCQGGKVLVIRHLDSTNSGDGAYSFSILESGSSSQLGAWVPLFRNNNYYSGGRNTSPVFYATLGGDSETVLYRLEASDGKISSVVLPTFLGNTIATEDRGGTRVGILRKDGVLLLLNASTLKVAKELRPLPPGISVDGNSSFRLHSAWDSIFISYLNSRQTTSLTEISGLEDGIARNLTLDKKAVHITFHTGRTKGADYTGTSP